MRTRFRIPRSAASIAMAWLFTAGSAPAVQGQQDAAAREVSRELQAMYEGDQTERESGQLSPERDRARLERVKQLLAGDSLRTGPDYYYAGVILQHSTDRTGRDHLLAHVVATMAALKGHEPGRWLAAAALDRFLVFNDMPQFFGTQFKRDSTGKWDAGSFDSWRTDSIRALFNVPTPDSLRRRAARWN